MWILLASCLTLAPPDYDLAAALEAAKAGGTVTLPAGRVRVEPVRLQGAEGLTIVGDDTTLVFSNLDGFGLSFVDCRNLMLRGFSIDYDPLPFTQGTITSRADDRSWFEFEVHAGYPDLSPDYLTKHPHVFSADAPRWKPGAPDLYPREVTALDPRHGRFTVNPSTHALEFVEVGDRVVFNQRNGGTIRLTSCDTVQVDGLTLLAGPGAGMLGRFLRGENRFRFDIEPGPPPPGATEPRLMSTCADAFNIAFARQGPVLEDSHFSFMGDDSVNLHGLTLAVIAAGEAHEWIVGRPYGTEPIDWLLEPGDVVRRLDPVDYSIRGTATIAAVERLRSPEETWREPLKAAWPRLSGNGTFYRLTLTEALEPVVGEWLDVPAAGVENWAIRNCTFADHRGRGARIMASHGVIENCTFRRIKQSAISLGPEYAFWRESGWVEDVVVRNNVLEDVCQGGMATASTQYVLGAIGVFARHEKDSEGQTAPALNRNLTIEGNTIDGCATAGIWVRAATDVVVRNNVVKNALRGDLSEVGRSRGVTVTEPIDVQAAGTVVVEGNEVTP